MEAEVFLRGGAAPARRVRVIAVNPLTNQASRAVVSLTDARVLSFENFPASDVPFTSEEANQALALAKSDPAVQRAIGDHLDRYQILESGSEGRVPWVAQVLPMRSTDPRDLCSVDRCVDIIFRTESGYLPFRAHVDLTIGAVELRGGGRHR